MNRQNIYSFIHTFQMEQHHADFEYHTLAFKSKFLKSNKPLRLKGKVVE